MSEILGPIVAVSMYDADRPDLVARVADAAAQAGLAGLAGLATYTSAADGSDGTVVVLEVGVGDLGLGPVEDTPAWRDLGDTLGAVVDAVRPAIAVAGFGPVLDLDAPAWRTERLTFCSGWVDVERLDLERRLAFNELAHHRLVEVRDGAVRWATPPGVPLGVALLDKPPQALAAATYEAWTGTGADLAEPPDPTVDPASGLSLPTLWLWPHDDAGEIVRGVAEALPDWDVVAEDHFGPYSVVVAVAPTMIDHDTALAALRTVVDAVSPAWAGHLPRGGFVPPGLDPDLPASGVVDDLWLRDDWAGTLRDDVAVALEGIDPESVGAGTLFVSGPDPRADRMGPFPWTPLERWARLVRVAGLLGDRVRDDVGDDGDDGDYTF